MLNEVFHVRKNLNSLIHVRLSSDDIEFLYFLSKKRNCSRSDVIRQIIGDYRRKFNNLGDLIVATQKPISTISYNSREFLLEKLNLWVEQHLIQTYQVIFHKGEDGDKDHAHVRIEPNKKLDPMDLTEKLKEFVQDNDKPLGVRPWRPSQEEDWFLYAVHDSQYLKLKYKSGEKGEKLPYKKKIL